MSHEIIIRSSNMYSNGVTNLGSEVKEAAQDAESIDYEIRYRPSHSDSEKQQGDKVARILRLVNKMHEAGD
jgi:hypothetical protein